MERRLCARARGGRPGRIPQGRSLFTEPVKEDVQVGSHAEMPDAEIEIIPSLVRGLNFRARRHTHAETGFDHGEFDGAGFRQALAPLLFEDEELAQNRTRRDPVAPAQVSDSAKTKKADRVTPDGFPVHSFDTLLRELATRCRNTCRIPSDPSGTTFQQLTEATPLQARAFQLSVCSQKRKPARDRFPHPISEIVRTARWNFGLALRSLRPASRGRRPVRS